MTTKTTKRSPEIHTAHASPRFVALCELDLACTYALHAPKLAIECCEAAIGAAIRAADPTLTYRACELLRALTGGK